MGDTSSVNEHLGESPAVEVTGKIMIVAVIILFMVVVFCLILHLYAKVFLDTIESQSRRGRRGRRHFVFANGQDQPLRRGLDPLVLRSLPILVFQSQKEEFKDGLECAVCLCEVVEGEKARLLPKCNHGFHVDCIDMWFQSHSTCPLCRNPVGVSESSPSSPCSSSVLQNATENGDEGSSSSSSEAAASENSPTFPTNVFIFGNQAQVSSIGALSEESTTTIMTMTTNTTTTTATNTGAITTTSSNRRNGMLVIDIPNEITSSLSPSASRFAEDDLKSPMSARLRSLKRLLSRDGRLNPWSPRSPVDVEQGGGAQQS